jgi:glycine hydroxymethyltransferase
VHAAVRGFTASHQFALETRDFGGGQQAAKLLRQANVLSCGIGLPIAEVDGDLNGLRFGTPEIVRWGMTAKDMPTVAGFIADVLTGKRAAQSVAPEVAAFRSQFDHLHFVRGA